jgi:hypothetical protein
VPVLGPLRILGRHSHFVLGEPDIVSTDTCELAGPLAWRQMYLAGGGVPQRLRGAASAIAMPRTLARQA